MPSKSIYIGLLAFATVLAVTACGSVKPAPAADAATNAGSDQSAYNAGQSAGASSGAPQEMMSNGLTPEAWCTQQSSGQSDKSAWATGCLAGLTGVSGSQATTLSPSGTPAQGCDQINETLTAAMAPGEMTLDLFSLASNIGTASANGQAPSLSADASAAGSGTPLAGAVAGITSGWNLLTNSAAGSLQLSPSRADLATIQRMMNGLNTAESLCATAAVSWTQQLPAIESSVFSSTGLS
jgi:hypothetical protein